jgi:hypothetical protein
MNMRVERETMEIAQRKQSDFGASLIVGQAHGGKARDCFVTESYEDGASDARSGLSRWSEHGFGSPTGIGRQTCSLLSCSKGSQWCRERDTFELT